METTDTPVIDWDAINLDDIPLCLIEDSECQSCT